ncbi:YdcH family protein [Vibrio amylolyticus]|uniref:YdcH family protein n=1 Tax=Vibrio amylolyticus TaxID=2847292 RepID=UPI003551F517
MLGESHSLLNDFPELKDVILRLTKQDETFKLDVTQYDTLDKEVRKLELQDSPISDEEMHQLKHDRAVLKDSLYQRLTSKQ